MPALISSRVSSSLVKTTMGLLDSAQAVESKSHYNRFLLPGLERNAELLTASYKFHGVLFKEEKHIQLFYGLSLPRQPHNKLDGSSVVDLISSELENIVALRPSESPRSAR